MKNKDTGVSAFFFKGILIGAVLAALLGCGTTATSRLYTLASLTDAGDNTPVANDGHALRVQVGPVQLPKYLDRPQIVTRLSPNEIRTADFDRWAEPLQDNVLRVLVENLSHLLRNEPIDVFSWEMSESANYRVSVNVSRFDGQLGGKVILMAVWTIYNKAENRPLLEKKSVITESCRQYDYASLVSAKSRALADFSREIAENIGLLPQNKNQ